MMDYTKYNVEDFASDQSFINWINKSDPDAAEFWSAFTLAHPELKIKIDQARTLVLNLKRSQNISVSNDQTDLLWERISDRITGAESYTPDSTKRNRWVWSYALASFLILSAFGIGYFFLPVADIKSGDAAFSLAGVPADFVEEFNPSETPVKIHLSDGSVVSLEGNSRLRYKRDYSTDTTRHVYLLGEAFFDVAKDPYKPFFVHSNELVTEVLGTSFRVRARQEDKDVVVSVKSGRVSVYAPKKLTSPGDREKNGVILLPNQQVMYLRKEQLFDKKLVDSPEVVPSLSSAQQTNFVFDNTPVSEVFKTLQDAYGIEIIFNEETMKNCFITAPLGSESLYEKLRIICRTIGASYEIVDANVIINSSGC